MKSFVSWIPNFLTLCNLICGCIGIVYAFKGEFNISFWMCISSAMFDFFDGFAARLLKAYSPLGKELDSLADMVSFGVMPAVVMFNMMQTNDLAILSYIAFAIAAFSALRLAKFNIDENQSSEFIGMPTPACALFFVSYALFAKELPFYWIWIDVCLVIVFSLLLVSPIKMMALKFSNFSLKDNWGRYTSILVALGLILIFQKTAVSIIILGYVVSNIIRYLATYNKL